MCKQTSSKPLFSWISPKSDGFNLFTKSVVRILSTTVFLVLGNFYTSAQVVFSSTTPGDHTFTVPAGVSILTIEAVGAGGPGGGNPGSQSGGASGGYIKAKINVTSGAIYNYHIGSSRNPVTPPVNDFHANSTYFGQVTNGDATTSLVLAGLGGSGDNLGGVCSNSSFSGTLLFAYLGGSGGDRSTGVNSAGGGGGQPACAAGNGTQGTNASGSAGGGGGSGGVCASSGFGGKGGNFEAIGENGSGIGSGGGGHGLGSIGTPVADDASGIGASGGIIISYATEITTQPLSGSYCKDAIANPLSIAVSASPTLSYKWFSNSSNANSGGTLVATTPTYTPPTGVAGSTFYYVVAASTTSGTSTSNAVEIKVGMVKNITSNQCYITIQAAIDAASLNDVIAIAPGIYSEALTISKNISLDFVADNDVTITTATISNGFELKHNKSFIITSLTNNGIYKGKGWNGAMINNGILSPFN
jgi:hypothetical protein